MTPEEIVKNNRIIADFMGGLTSDKSSIVSGYQNIWLPIHGICNWTNVENGNGKTLHYHDSWDWLIPVVDKIQRTNKADIEIKMKGLVLISYNKETKKYYNSTLIENLYEVCVDFINWYNENKQ